MQGMIHWSCPAFCCIAPVIALVRYMHATCSAGGISEIQPIMCSRAGIVDSGPRAQREAFAQVSMTDSILQWI